MFLSTLVRSQNFTTREHCFLSDFILNPAAAGTEEDIVAILSAKKNWMGIKGSPGTNMLNIHAKVSDLGLSKPKKYISRDLSRIGVGLGIYNDSNGPLSVTGVQAAYAQHVRLSSKLLFSAGISVKLSQYVLDETVFKATDPDDPNISYQKEKTLMPNFNVGIYLRHKKFHIGLSTTNPAELKNKNVVFYKLENVRTLYLSGAYKFTLPNEKDLEVRAITRYFDGQFWADFIARYYYKKFFWYGVGYATTDFYSVYGALRFKKLDFGYVYEYTPSPIYKRASGNHMVFIAYNL
jgi:type IX secretion system PorP/SprF family membrane protein